MSKANTHSLLEEFKKSSLAFNESYGIAWTMINGKESKVIAIRQVDEHFEILCDLDPLYTRLEVIQINDEFRFEDYTPTLQSLLLAHYPQCFTQTIHKERPNE